MEKRTYEAPVADLLRFDYRETVTASGTGRNVQCIGKSYGGGCDGYRTEPGPCYQDAGILEASECLGL